MFSERLKRVSASPTQQITSDTDNLKRKGIDVIDFGAGEPDFFTPTHIKESGIAAISNNFTRYTQNRGVLELREAICARYEQDYSVKSDPEEIIVTAGGKQALFNVMMAIVDEGDEVISHIPGWPSIFEHIRLNVCKNVNINDTNYNIYQLLKIYNGNTECKIEIDQKKVEDIEGVLDSLHEYNEKIPEILTKSVYIAGDKFL